MQPFRIISVVRVIFALNHQWSVEVHGALKCSKLLNVFVQRLGQPIKTEIVLLEINFFEKPLFHNRIVRRIHLVFKNGFLDALPVILTYLGSAAQPPPSFRRFRRHIEGKRRGLGVLVERGDRDQSIHSRNERIDNTRTGHDLKVVLHVLGVDRLTALADANGDYEAIPMRKIVLSGYLKSSLHIQAIDTCCIAAAHDPLAEAVCLLSGFFRAFSDRR